MQIVQKFQNAQLSGLNNVYSNVITTCNVQHNICKSIISSNCVLNDSYAVLLILISLLNCSNL